MTTNNHPANIFFTLNRIAVDAILPLTDDGQRAEFTIRNDEWRVELELGTYDDTITYHVGLKGEDHVRGPYTFFDAFAAAKFCAKESMP